MTRTLIARRVPPPRRPAPAVMPLPTAGAGLFSGYASLFGVADDQGDLVAPGAFARALEMRGPHRIALLYQHEPAQPVGTWLALREDHHGLWAEGRLVLDSQSGAEAHALPRALIGDVIFYSCPDGGLPADADAPSAAR